MVQNNHKKKYRKFSCSPQTTSEDLIKSKVLKQQHETHGEERTNIWHDEISN